MGAGETKCREARERKEGLEIRGSIPMAVGLH